METDDPDPGLDSPGIKAHPDGTGARKKTASSASASSGVGGMPYFTWLPRMPGQPRSLHTLGQRARCFARVFKGSSHAPTGLESCSSGSSVLALVIDALRSVNKPWQGICFVELETLMAKVVRVPGIPRDH